MKPLLITLTAFILTSSTTYSQIDSAYCQKIEASYDEYEASYTYETPLLYMDNIQMVGMSRIVKENKSRYFLFLNVETASFSGVGAKGVIILFDDGTRLSFPAQKVEVKVSGNKYRYSSFVEVTSKLSSFKSKNIKGYKLFIHSKELNWGEGNRMKLWANCLSNDRVSHLFANKNKRQRN